MVEALSRDGIDCFMRSGKDRLCSAHGSGSPANLLQGASEKDAEGSTTLSSDGRNDARETIRNADQKPGQAAHRSHFYLCNGRTIRAQVAIYAVLAKRNRQRLLDWGCKRNRPRPHHHCWSFLNPEYSANYTKRRASPQLGRRCFRMLSNPCWNEID